jgi:hypothetical protein
MTYPSRLDVMAALATGLCFGAAIGALLLRQAAISAGLLALGVAAAAASALCAAAAERRGAAAGREGVGREGVDQGRSDQDQGGSVHAPQHAGAGRRSQGNSDELVSCFGRDKGARQPWADEAALGRHHQGGGGGDV